METNAGGLLRVPCGHTRFSWAGRNAAESVPPGHTWASWYGSTTSSENEARARAYGKLAGVMRKRGQPKRALAGLTTALEMAPALPATHFNLGCVWDDLGAQTLAIAHFDLAASLKPSFAEALDCLAGALLKRGGRRDLERALAACEQALRLNIDDSAAHWNLGSALRRLGKSEEAIDRAWTAILAPAQRSDPVVVKVQALASSSEGPNTNKLAVVCVKWGTKYGAAYVNRLRAAVRRHLRNTEHEFFCFTEDAAQVEGKTCPLPNNGWTGWWHKASALFSGHLETHVPDEYTRILYLDLDTVIVGDLDELGEYRGPFATLYTTDFDRTEDRADGYNSSILLFARGNTALQTAIYRQLNALGIDLVKRHVHRLDFWLEMTVQGADSLQALFPGRMLDYKTHVRDADTVPASASVVNFPLRPKPHEIADAPWMKKHWVLSAEFVDTRQSSTAREGRDI